MRRYNVLSALFAVVAVVGAMVATPRPAVAQGLSVVCWDKAFANAPGTAYVVTGALSKASASKAVHLNVWGATPNNSTVTVTLLHTDAGGTVRPFAYPALTLANGVISTNLTLIDTALGKAVPYGVRGDDYVVAFSTATNGVFGLVGELYSPPIK